MDRKLVAVYLKYPAVRFPVLYFDGAVVQLEFGSNLPQTYHISMLHACGYRVAEVIGENRDTGSQG